MKKSMSKTQSRNSMAKSHELPDIDKLEENRGTINQQIDRKSKMQSIAFCLSHLIDDYSFCKHEKSMGKHKVEIQWQKAMNSRI